MNRGEEGATATMVILGIAALLASALVAIDAGSILNTKRGLIADTDAAALGTAIELVDDRCASESDARAEAELIAQTNDPQTVVTDFELDRGGDCTAAYGTVQVVTENPAPLFFAPFFGVNQWDALASSVAVYGRIQAMSGLRPIGVCGDDPHYAEWLALQTALRDGNTTNDAAAQAAYDALRGAGLEHPVYAGAGVVHRLPFQRLGAGSCDLGAPAGNWGWLDLDGGGNSNADLNAWIANGYPGTVDLGLPGGGDEDCVEGAPGFDDCEGATGGRGNSTRAALNSITCPAGSAATDDNCTIIYVVVYDAINVVNGNGNGGGGNGGGNGNGGGGNGGGGANTDYHPVSFLGLVIRAHDLGTGQVFDDTSWIDLEFVDELTEGQIGPASSTDLFPGPRGVQLCGSEHFDGCPTIP